MNTAVSMSDDEERENPLPPLDIATYSTSHGGIRPPGGED